MISRRNLTDAALAQIAARDGSLNAFVDVDVEGARAAAEAADRRRLDGRPLGVLDGLAFAVKDNLAVKERPWAAGIAGRRDMIAESDSFAVAGLRAAGAVLVGRTNMEEAAFGAVRITRHSAARTTRCGPAMWRAGPLAAPPPRCRRVSSR